MQNSRGSKTTKIVKHIKTYSKMGDGYIRFGTRVKNNNLPISRIGGWGATSLGRIRWCTKMGGKKDE